MDDLSPQIAETGANPLLAGARLTIDLAALTANWQMLAERSGKAKSAAVLKADAYGLGADRVAPALADAGCETFFVALPEEGISLRRVVPEAEIFVIGGVSHQYVVSACAEAMLTPVLNTREEIEVWADFWNRRGSRRPCAIHVDTGMNRLGLTVKEALAFAQENDQSHAVTPTLLMSHLACADERGHELNARQLESFQRVSVAFEHVDSSLCNSAGIFLGPEYLHDFTRPGISLYGGAPQIGEENPMKPVVTAEARVLQIRNAKAGETVGYGAAVTLERDTRIAVAAAGYADGFHRAGSGHNVPARAAIPEGGYGWIAGVCAPMLGRITMDLTMLDVTDAPTDTVNVGNWVELLGPHVSIDDAARAAGTIPYEILTSLGDRFFRRYVGDGLSDG